MNARLARRALAVSLSCALITPASFGIAAAQEAETPGVDQPTEAEPTTRESAPNTDHCPNSLTPPEPTTTSEALAPGQQAPEPLPVAADGHCGVSAPEGFEVPEDVLASAWMITDLDTGEIIAQKDPHGRYRPASVIKVLLALEVIDRLDPEQKVIASEESAAQDGSAVGLGAGGEYTVNELLHGLLLASGNDAAHQLAQELGGDERTLELINERARKIGTTDTRAATYSGLDAPGMSSSAHDLALIYEEAFKNEVFARVVNTEYIDFPGYDEHEGYEVWNDNHLFMFDPDGIGGKTGFTDDANHTFVGALDRDGRRLMAVILDTTIAKARPWQQAQALLHEAYEVPAGAGIGRLEPVAKQETEAAPTPTPRADDTAAQSTPTSDEAATPYVGVGIVAVVVVLVGLVAAAVFATRRR